MGLDSVELIIEMENYFGIEIPDRELEQIHTPNEMADAFLKRITLLHSKVDLKEELWIQVITALKTLHFPYQNLTPTSVLRDCFPCKDIELEWLEFKASLGLKVPQLTHEVNLSLLDKLPYYSKPLTLNHSIARLMECIGMMNYTFMINREALRSAYEVRVAIMGITCECTGVGASDVYGDSSFTSDLGIA